VAGDLRRANGGLESARLRAAYAAATGRRATAADRWFGYALQEAAAAAAAAASAAGTAEAAGRSASWRADDAKAPPPARSVVYQRWDGGEESTVYCARWRGAPAGGGVGRGSGAVDSGGAAAAEPGESMEEVTPGHPTRGLADDAQPTPPRVSPQSLPVASLVAAAREWAAAALVFDAELRGADPSPGGDGGGMSAAALRRLFGAARGMYAQRPCPCWLVCFAMRVMRLPGWGWLTGLTCLMC
jgi:hypothetical protein